MLGQLGVSPVSDDITDDDGFGEVDDDKDGGVNDDDDDCDPNDVNRNYERRQGHQ